MIQSFRDRTTRLTGDRRLRRGLLVLLVAVFGLALASHPLDTVLMVRNAAIVAVMLSLIIGIHEFSHLLAARLFGVTVHEFGLGFGPLLKARTAFGIRWCLRALPLGGYIKTKGETTDEGPGSLEALPVWKRVIVWYVGPLSNFALAFVLLFGFLLTMAASVGKAWTGTWTIIELIVSKTIGMTISGFAALPHDPLATPLIGLPGMVTIVTPWVINQGGVMIVLMAAILSASIGLVNILPIPPLDGGHAVLAIARGLLGRYYPQRLAAILTTGGLAFIVGFSVLITGLDIARAVVGYRITP